MTAAVRRGRPADGEHADPAARGFLFAVLARLRPRTVASALLILIATDILGRIARVGMDKRFPVPATQSQCVLVINVLFVACMTLALLVSDEAVARGARRWPTYLLATLLACLFATWAQRAMLVWLGWDNIWVHAFGDLAHDWMQPLGIFSSYWLYCTLACVVYVNHRTARLAAQRLHAAELARARSRRRTLESRLQAMQARVEPQFLFNTLAQVRELHECDTDAAGRMLEDLIAYLRAALPHLRESSSTLGQEVALARAYLDIMRIRLGEKLRFEIQLPDALANARMPPMMLLPLVDHALLQHALGPGRSVGDIRITTELRDNRIVLAVADSGGAFLPDVSTESLDGIAQRLHALYGDDARLARERIAERGTRATLEVPHEIADGSDR